jgi:glycosyltransferase involved in cell wall biosynthesis
MGKMGLVIKKMKRIRVLFTASGSHIGGATMAMFHLMLGLASLGVEPILLSTIPKQEYLRLYQRLRAKNIRIVLSKLSFRGLSYWVWLFFSTIRTIKKHRIDIVHCHGTKEALVVGLAAKLLRRKIVYTVEGDPNLEISISPYNYSLLDKLFLRFSWSIGLKLADRIVGCSNWMAEHLRKYGLEAAGIPNPIDYERFSRVTAQGSNIVCIARFEKAKNIETLIVAASEVLKRYPEIKLVVVGGGTQEKELRALAEGLSISNNVEFHNFRPDVENVLSDAAVFVLPSIYEPFGMVAAEALAAGLPIIASRVGGLREIVKDGINGFSFNPKDWQDLSKKILLLLENQKLREEMKNKAKESAKDFSPENIALKYLRVYFDVLRKV